MKRAYIFGLAIGFYSCCLNAAPNSCLAQEPYQSQQPYKLGVQENIQGQPSGGYSYPAPQVIPTPARPAVKIPRKTPQYSGNAVSSAPSPETFSTSVTSVALPPAFLGAWQVHGQRTAVEAMPEFQAGAERSFAMSNDQVWNISGNPAGGYTLGSNTGINTALYIDKVQGSTAFVRYQHPVGNTMAQEAIVMSLRAGGLQFDGLERISIVKQGLPQPRAKVTYNLFGMRQ
jgi:hypothetical protein